MVRPLLDRTRRDGSIPRRGRAALLLIVLAASVLAAVGDAAPAQGAALPTCGGLTATIVGTSGNDLLIGTEGADVIVGLGGSDEIKGMGGNDTMCGGGKNDTLEGGPGTDRALGGPGTDTCTAAETKRSCEVIPPAACGNPPLVPATTHTTNLNITGSNAFATRSSLLLDGEARRLTFVAEVRNNTTGSIRLGRAEIAIYNAADTRIGTRFASATADALAPGQRAVLTETMPSLIYFSDETNGFPDGWASWTLTLNATMGQPATYHDVIIGSRLRALGVGSGGHLTGNGVAVNSLDREITSIHWWVALYDAGELINVGEDSDYLYPDGLAPGATTSFEVTIWSDEPICFTGVSWGAAGS